MLEFTKSTGQLLTVMLALYLDIRGLNIKAYITMPLNGIPPFTCKTGVQTRILIFFPRNTTVKSSAHNRNIQDSRLDKCCDCLLL